MEAFSLKATKKSIEGGSHADRDAQFQYIHRIGKAFEAKGQPVISVDCKKKDLIGNAQEQGREWQAKGQETTVKGRLRPYLFALFTLSC